MNRWPPLILVIAMVAALLFFDQRTSASTDAQIIPAVAGMGPAAAPVGASGSTWYCPAGFATPDGANDHLVVITNPSDQPVTGTLTLFPALVDIEGNSLPFARAAQPLDIAPMSQSTIELGPLVASLDPDLATSGGALVAAMVEVDAGGVFVDHSVGAFQGRDVGPCATSAAQNWWFASGTTTAEVGYQLYLLNPFPDDAVVDISFVTDAGSRSPSAFAGKLIPAQSLTVLQVSPEVRVNAQATAQITARRGRVIAERIQLFENPEGPGGLSLSMGSNRLSEQWFFPAGRSAPGAGESYVIYNPSDSAAEVEFELKPDSADRLGDVAPLVVPVGSRERWIVSVTGHPTHPVDELATIVATMPDGVEQFFVSIRSFNGVPILAERVLTRPLGQGGVTASVGVDVAATNQLVAIPALIDGADAATLAVLNPAGNTISRVQLIVGGPDGERGLDTVELAPRRRASFEVMDLYALDVEDDAYDVVHAHQVLQHVSDPVAALREMQRVAKPGGIVAVRDADYAGMHWAPALPALDDWLRIYRQVAYANNAEPDAGRHLIRWAREADLERFEPSLATWLFAEDKGRTWWGSTWSDRVLSSSLSAQAVEGGFASADELETISAAWRRWAADPDAWFVVPHAQLICHV